MRVKKGPDSKMYCVSPGTPNPAVELSPCCRKKIPNFPIFFRENTQTYQYLPHIDIVHIKLKLVEYSAQCRRNCAVMINVCPTSNLYIC